MRALLLSGTHSGVGKTTVTLGLIAALRARGLKVRAFKAGPDFLDPAHLAAASGAPCLNLDGWMLGAELCRARLAQAAAEGAEVAIVEGMMGLYDGLSGSGETGSTAELAKWLDLPVVLVADASGGARSLAATVLGFRNFDLAVRLTGVIFNRIGGPGHLEYLRQAMASLDGVAFLGGLPADERLHLPERHLGLALPASAPPPAAWAESHLDLDLLLAQAVEVAASHLIPPSPPPSSPLALGLARDEAFCFYYPDNLDLLRAAGLELVEFSPLRDAALPAGVRGLYFGGGYPELHAAALAANAPMRAAVAAFAAAGGFIYAECGGLMYLARSLEGQPMAGVLPCHVTMHSRLQAIGYREVRPVGLNAGLGAAANLRARGHEFHYSSLTRADDAQRWLGVAGPQASASTSGTRAAGALGPAPSNAAPAHEVLLADGSSRPEGFHCGNTLASYIHLHFASCPALPALMRARLAPVAAERLFGKGRDASGARRRRARARSV